MALIKCSECGKEVSDKATACPNCGAPIEKSAISSFDASQYSGKVSKKNSALAVASCVCTAISIFVFGWLSLIGIILGLVDLGVNDKSKSHVGSIFGVIVGIIIFIGYIFYLNKLMRFY